MVNFENAKIYKIVDNTNGNVYIGSTTEPTLARRLAKHVGSYKFYTRDNTKTKYMTSFKIIENGNYDIILLEKCQNITCKDELHARERFYIENNQCVNKVIIGRTQKEYYNENKDKIIERTKQYRENNKQAIKQKRSEKFICVCGCESSKLHKSRHEKTQKHQDYLNKN